MPSKTWTRGDGAPTKSPSAKQTIKSTVASDVAVKRKATWERGVDPEPLGAPASAAGVAKRPRRSVDGASHPAPLGAKLSAKAPPFEPKRAIEAKLKAVEDEKAKLRAAIEAQRRRVDEARDAKEKKETEIRDKAERAKRAGNLLSGFRNVRKVAEEREDDVETVVEELSAEEIELRAVRRVALAGSDWAILDLPPGSQKKWIKKSYMELAKVLHPDKCRAAGAKEAFQKLSKAYRALSSSDS